MPVHLTETTSRGSVPVLSAEQGNLDRDTVADDDLQHRIALFLCVRGVPQAEALEVETKGGTVTVRGRLPNKQAKCLCLECCRHVAGVLKLIDDVEVESSMQEDAAEDTEKQINDNATGALPRNPR